MLKLSLQAKQRTILELDNKLMGLVVNDQLEAEIQQADVC